MTREKIIKLAQQAGFHVVIDNLPGGKVRRSVKSMNLYCTDEIAKFAELIAADEREECAKVCEDMATHYGEDDDGYVADHCAIVIRERAKL